MDDSDITILVAIIGLIGVVIGSHLTNRGSTKLYKRQQLKEQKNVAKAIDISFEEFSKEGDFRKLTELYISEKQSTSRNRSYPMFPLYSLEDPYFVFKQDISKFERNLAASIYQFYNDLIKAEMYRLYIKENVKDQSLHPMCEICLIEMKARMISCYNKIPEIRQELKKIHEEFDE